MIKYKPSSGLGLYDVAVTVEEMIKSNKDSIDFTFDGVHIQAAMNWTWLDVVSAYSHGKERTAKSETDDQANSIQNLLNTQTKLLEKLNAAERTIAFLNDQCDRFVEAREAKEAQEAAEYKPKFKVGDWVVAFGMQGEPFVVSDVERVTEMLTQYAVCKYDQLSTHYRISENALTKHS